MAVYEMKDYKSLKVTNFTPVEMPKLFVTEQPTIVTCRVCRGERMHYIKHSDNRVTLDRCYFCRGSGIQDNWKLREQFMGKRVPNDW